MNLSEQFRAVRKASEDICQPLQTEDYVVQPIADVSPPKWHLGHITWFWEAFVLEKYLDGYKLYDPEYHFVFNSYYESLGKGHPHGQGQSEPALRRGSLPVQEIRGRSYDEA